jgi:predicted TIM-barrel fold metal-dependent hydrolase
MTPDYIDAHVHVWKPADVHFPYDSHYSGPPAAPTSFTPELLLAIAGAAGVKRIVLVQMSFYGTDNSYMLDAMQRHPSVFSGIAVVDHDATCFGGEMTHLASLGIRGFRLHRLGYYTAQGADFTQTNLPAPRAVGKTLRGKVQKPTFPPRLGIPQTAPDSHFATATTPAG